MLDLILLQCLLVLHFTVWKYIWTALQSFYLDWKIFCPEVQCICFTRNLNVFPYVPRWCIRLELFRTEIRLIIDYINIIISVYVYDINNYLSVESYFLKAEIDAEYIGRFKSFDAVHTSWSIFVVFYTPSRWLLPSVLFSSYLKVSLTMYGIHFGV